MPPDRPPAPPREREDGTADDGPGRPVNTLGPTPLKPALDEEARQREAEEFHEFRTGEKSMKADARAAQRQRDAAGRAESARLAAARFLPSHGGRSRWLDTWRKCARRLTGREIDTRLMTEAERTRAAHERQAMARRLIDPRPRHLYGRLDWRRRFRELGRRLIGREIDTRLLTDRERAAATRELWRQLSAADREAMRVQLARDKEAARLESWRVRPVQKLKPD